MYVHVTLIKFVFICERTALWGESKDMHTATHQTKQRSKYLVDILTST
jgi:hypothetical protein